MSPRLSDVLLSSQSDERLVKLAQAGHDRAFVAIVERYRPELHALARRLCSDGRGEDVVQQAFLSAFAALRSGAEVKHLRGWLYRIVRNAALRSRVPVCVPLDGGTASAETVEDLVQQRAVALTAITELARLPARQRQAIVDTALAGRARAEVASSMGVSEGAVRQLVHRARSTIRAAVTAVTPWPLAQWTAGGPPGGASPVEVAAGAAAGAASTGGFLSVKLGIVLASGAIATGVAAVDIHGLRHPVASRSTARTGAIAGHPRSARHGVRAVELAAVAPAAVSATVVTPAVGSRGVLSRAVQGSAAVVYVGASGRSRNASHGGGRRPKAPGGADTRTGEQPQPSDDGRTDGGRTHTGAEGGGGTDTAVTDSAARGPGDGSGGSGRGGSSRQDGGGDLSAGRSDSSDSGSGQGVDGGGPEASAASSGGTGSDAAGGGDGAARRDGVGSGGGGTSSGGGDGGSAGGGSNDGDGGATTGVGGSGGDTGQLVPGLITDVSGSYASGH